MEEYNKNNDYYFSISSQGQMLCKFKSMEIKSNYRLTQMGYSRKNPHGPLQRMESIFNHPSNIDFLKPKTPLLSGFPRQKTPLPPGFPGKKGVKVNQLFTFFTSIITRNNRDLTWNYSTVARWVWVRIKMCQAFQTLRCNNVAMVFSILFTFSAIKGPGKELKLSFMSGEKYVNKTFLLFSGSESAKVSSN